MKEYLTLNTQSVSGLSRYIPEPESWLNQAGKTLRQVASYATQGAGLIARSQISGEFNSLITAQSEAQKQLMLVSMQSNLLRTEHETKMAAVRNMRVA